jgi:tetratricopeptide (TPR) repeat protein
LVIFLCIGLISQEKSMNKGTSEIVKLTERISRDPKSKLFVPLAEEYKKAGDIEMAVHVLLEGLKQNPSYVTARSFLGRLLMEKGDLVGAQKEFEEVVKAIPDNLLAQKKLGDLYALQKNPSEALKHYKIVVALNPGDEELVSLVADLEPGVDVNQRLQQQKAGPSSGPVEKPAKKTVPEPSAPVVVGTPEARAPEPAKTVAVQERTEALERPKAPERTKTAERAGQEEPETIPEPRVPSKRPVEDGVPSGNVDLSEPAGPKETKATAAKAEPELLQPAAGPAGTEQGIFSPAMQQESEEPEDVLIVEPIEEELPPTEAAPSSGLDLFAGAAEESVPAASEDGQIDSLFTAPELPREEPGLFEEALGEPVAPPEIAIALSEEPAPVLPEQEPAAEQKIDQSDDFTTDTLAELYIAQGFFEKAIDIYQRMLADRPDSRGLKDKLERVKAMAASAVEPSVAGSPAAGAADEKQVADIFSQPSEYIPPAEATETVREEEILLEAAEEPANEGIPSGPGMYTAPADEHQEEEITIEAELFVEPEEVAEGAGPAGKGSEDNIFAEPVEYRPKAGTEPEEGPPPVIEERTAEENAFDIFTSPRATESSREKPLYNDFEPREYIPPSAEPRAKDAKMTASLKQPLVARKETIDRLENWLKNIIKEK